MNFKVALIPGDGNGKEVVPEGARTLEALSQKFGFDCSFTEFPYSCAHYLEHGVMMPPDLGGKASTTEFTDQVIAQFSV